MSKLKTHRTAAKRFKISGSGKILRLSSYNSHMFFHKSGARKRRLEIETELFGGERWRISRLLGVRVSGGKSTKAIIAPPTEEQVKAAEAVKAARRKLAL
jgi:large subunit ribosomal protein L35